MLRGDITRNNLGVATKPIEIQHGMGRRHAESAAPEGTRNEVRDDAETPKATIQSGAKMVLADTPCFGAPEPFISVFGDGCCWLCAGCSRLKFVRMNEQIGFYGVGTTPRRRGIKLPKQPLEAC